MADLLRKYKSLYSSTANSFSTGTGVTITPASVVGLPTTTEIALTFDRVNSSGVATPSSMERIIGSISAGNFVVRTSPSSGRGAEGTEQAHTSPVVEMVWNAKDWNDAIDHITTEHNQDGTHKKVTGLDNNTAITQKNSSGTAKSLLKINSSNQLEVGSTDIPLKPMITSLAQGDLLYINASGELARLAAGTSGQYLKTQGSGANPTWDSISSDGWITSSDTWVYASASTFTISGVDRTSVYVKGTRLRFKQGGGYKYAVVVNSSFSTNTTVTILVNSDHTIANASITDNGYSYLSNPPGYPAYFNVSTTITAQTAFTNSPTTNYARIYIDGNLATAMYKWTYHGTSGGGGQTRATLPLTPSADGVGFGSETTNQIATAVAVSQSNNRIEVQRYDGNTIISNNVGVAIVATYEF